MWWATMTEHDRTTEVVLYEVVLGNAHAEPSDRCSYWRRSFHSKQLLKPGFSHHILSRQKLPKIPQGTTVWGKRVSGAPNCLGAILEGWNCLGARGLERLEYEIVRSIVLIASLSSLVSSHVHIPMASLYLQRTIIELRNSWKAETRLSANPSSPTHTYRSCQENVSNVSVTGHCHKPRCWTGRLSPNSRLQLWNAFGGNAGSLSA